MSCERMIPQVSGTCYLNACLNGFLQTSSTLGIFFKYLTLYEKTLDTDLLSQLHKVDGSFCPPKSLIETIANTHSTQARFNVARFVIMKTIRSYILHYDIYKAEGADIPNSIASFILQTTKAPLKDVETQGGHSIDVAKAILKSIYGPKRFIEKVQILHEHELSRPILETTEVLIILPGIKGDEYLFAPEWDSWYKGCSPEDILDFSLALFASNTKSYRQLSDEAKLESQISFHVSELLVLLSNLLASRKRKRDVAVTYDGRMRALELLLEFRDRNDKEYEQFTKYADTDDSYKSLQLRLLQLLHHNKTEVEVLKTQLRRGYVTTHNTYEITQINGYELGHAVLSYDDHAVVGIFCDNEPFIVDSNEYVYPSDWRSSKTVQLMNYDNETMNKCTRTNNCGVDYVCYVRK